MKKAYTAPEIEVKQISSTDVITVSGGLVATKFNKTGIDNSISF